MIEKVEINIAVVSFNSLGDSLLYVLLAYNLRKNGYAVTYYGHVGYALRAWLPELNILPYPSLDDMDDVLSEYHLVLMSPMRYMRDRFEVDADYLAHIKSLYLLICIDVPKSWQFDHHSRLQKALPTAIYQTVKPLIDATGSIRFKKFKNESMVDIFCAYMHEKMQLGTVYQTVNLSPLGHLDFRKHKTRIVVSPDSAGPLDKNWGEMQFLSLCRTLKMQGFNPVIVVAPAHHATWQALAKEAFEVPMFESLASLAEYIYESGLLIANDSGNGHLASFLGLPTVTIYKKANSLFTWRPAWAGSTNIVVYPKLVFKILRYRVWRPFVTVNMVMKAVHILLKKH